jgi:transposase
MRYPKKPPIVLRKREQAFLEAFAHSRTQSQRCVARATIIVRLAAGETKQAIAQELRLTRKVVYTWYNRWLQAEAKLAVVADAPDKACRQLIEEILTDQPRAGAPLRFSAEQICQIMALACQKPEDLGLPFTTWTPSELARAAIDRKIVASISTSSVGRFLKSGRLTAS